MTQNTWQRYELSDLEFNKLRKVIYDLTGIALKDNKREMLYSRLSKRLRQLGLNNFQEYIDIFSGSGKRDEIGHLVNAVTTNLTRFFREGHHYDHLVSNVIPQVIKGFVTGKISEFIIWSAGCSAGMEAYSAAMVLHKHIPATYHKNIKILATDIDTNMLQTGKDGIYTKENRETVPEMYKHYFKPVPTEKNKYELHPALKKMVHFKYLNLLNGWPFQKKFDVIFCRNVMIYFDRKTRDSLVERYVNQIQSGGYLYLGHSESLIDPDLPVKSIGKSIFEKFNEGRG